MEGKLFVVSACSGAGKTSLVEHIIKKLGSQFALKKVITYTSKNPRINEIDGKDYHFLSSPEFQERAEKGFFLEWSTRYGHYYGSPISIVQDMHQGFSYIIIVDLAGAQLIERTIKHAVLIWIGVKNKETLKTRLLARNTETCEQINERLNIADQEINQQELLNIFTYKIINDNFENALGELEMIIVDELSKMQKNEQKK